MQLSLPALGSFMEIISRSGQVLITALNDEQITDQARVANKYIEHVLDIIRNGNLELQMLALSWFCDRKIRTVACKRK
jgi:hypothetical protein